MYVGERAPTVQRPLLAKSRHPLTVNDLNRLTKIDLPHNRLARDQPQIPAYQE